MSDKEVWDKDNDEFEETENFDSLEENSVMENDFEDEDEPEELVDEVVDYMGGENFDDILTPDWEE